MEALRERLDDLLEHKNDRKWLAAHADTLYGTLESALNTPPQVNDAIEALIAICPSMFTRSDFKRWSSLLFDALVNAQLLQDDDLQARVWAQMGESYYMAGQHSEARRAFETALERARQGRTQEMLLAAYIGIIRLQSLRLDTTFNVDFVREVLNLGRLVDDQVLHANLYHALAIACTHRGDTPAALSYGQVAYARWYMLENTVEMARTAFTLAAAYRVAGCNTLAARLLSISASLFTETDYAPSYCATSYEEGILCLQNKKYEAAQQWLTIALDEALKLDHLHYITMSRHALALAQVELRQYYSAEANLKVALHGWQELGNYFYQANVLQAMGYLEGLRGNIPLANDWLQQGLQMCSQIPDTPVREMTERLIRETLTELN